MPTENSQMTSSSSTDGLIIDEKELQLRKLKLMRQKVALQQGLPHLYGFKWYKWAWEFFNATDRMCFISAANQISKSSSQIRRIIHRATEPSLWPKLWKTTPRMFWYFYPNKSTATIEFETKWKPEFLPRGEYATDKQYGWRADYRLGEIYSIVFNSGVTLYFKSYGQDIHDLQTGTVAEINLDEEPPEEMMSELFMRLAASDGYMSAVMTPTRGQEYWREVFEEIGTRNERFPKAFKRQISMFDCTEYADGTPSPWNTEKINYAINACSTPQQVEVRVHGKFANATGLKYSAFHDSRNVIAPEDYPKDQQWTKDWLFYVGCDIGSGEDNHPAAVAVLAVRPDGRFGRFIRGWRGDGIATTAGDVVEKAVQMSHDLPVASLRYDHASRDFYNIAIGMGLAPTPAEKSHLIGEQVLNVGFKNRIIMIDDVEELRPLRTEIRNLKKDTPKKQAKDDFTDAARYAATAAYWDWSAIESAEIIKLRNGVPVAKKADRPGDDRRRYYDGEDKKLVSIEDELDEWNRLSEGDVSGLR
jgi:phage terminase large subunit-like protein